MKDYVDFPEKTNPPQAKKPGRPETIPFKVHRKRMRDLLLQADIGPTFDDDIPASLLSEYKLDEDGLARNEKLQKKYIKRARNIKRSWNRTRIYMPELMAKDVKPMDVLELSTAHGGMLEVARHFGHNVMGTDYPNFIFSKGKSGYKRLGKETEAPMRALNDQTFARSTDDYGIEISGDVQYDWPYRYICESVDLPMNVFDGGKTPYPFDDKSYDVLMCFQAIEHYCHPDHWMDIVDEMCRITRKSVFILLNQAHPKYKTQPGYLESFEKARRELAQYNANGFTCMATFLRDRQVLGFKLIAT